MAEGQKTYTAEEHLAVLESRVSRETAEITAERDALQQEKTDLESKLDVEISAKEAAEQRATEAEKALEDFKAEVESEREAAARKDERIAKVREAASHLDDEFFDDTKRVARIVAMSDEQFDGYVADLSATGRTPGKTTDAPRETAMRGDAGGDKSTGNARATGRSFLMRDYVAPAAKGA